MPITAIATDSEELKALVGKDTTATFEEDPNFVESNPTANASTESVEVQRDTDDVADSDEEVEEDDDVDEDEEFDDEDDEDDDEEDDDEGDVEEGVDEEDEDDDLDTDAVTA